MELNLLETVLSAYHADQTPIALTLQNKTRITGKIKAFDSYVIVIENQKQEFIYRHSVSSISAVIQKESKQPPAHKSVSGEKPAHNQTPPRPAKYPSQKTKTPRPASKTPMAAANESSLNNTMKEGLLKWMQEQKAAK